MCEFSSSLSVVSVDGKQHLSEEVFSAFVRFSFWGKWQNIPRTWLRLLLLSLQKTRLLWFSILLTLPATSGCSSNSRGHWKESDFRQERTLWKSDESTKHCFTQMLLAINSRYWQARKIHACVWRFKVAPCKRASLKSTTISQKKVGYFSNRPRTCWKKISRTSEKNMERYKHQFKKQNRLQQRRSLFSDHLIFLTVSVSDY